MPVKADKVRVDQELARLKHSAGKHSKIKLKEVVQLTDDTLVIEYFSWTTYSFITGTSDSRVWLETRLLVVGPDSRRHVDIIIATKRMRRKKL